VNLESALLDKKPFVTGYGPPGSGKTSFFASLGSVLDIIDCDEGLRPCLTLKDGFSDLRKQVNVRPCWEEVLDEKGVLKPTSFSKARSYVQGIASECRAKTYKYKALMLDSLTNLCDAAMNETLAFNGRLGKPAQIQDWGDMARKVTDLLMQIKALPVVKILIAHIDRYEEGGETKNAIGISGKVLPRILPVMMDEIWYFKVIGFEKPQFQIQTLSSSSTTCKTRYNVENNSLAVLGAIEVFRRMGFDLTAATSSATK
jgi:hypothetical protein